MSFGRIEPQELAKAALPPPKPVRHFHTWTRPGSRRQFLRAVGVTSGALVATTALKPGIAFAATDPTPRPIPGGFRGSAVGDTGNKHFYHVLPPLPPGTDGQQGQYSECSTITDFVGVMGAANINGTGTGTPTQANAAGKYNFNVDMRFMSGDYIAVDGRRRSGTFGFI